MLVKFLSYTASVIGTARYKAVLLPSLIVALSLTGIASVVLMKDDVPAGSASSSVEKPAEDDASDTAPTLGSAGAKSQATKDQSAQTSQDNTSQQQSTASPDAPKNNSSDSATNPAFSVSLSTDTVSIAPGDTSSAITATTSDGSNVSWSIAPESQNNVHVVIDQNNSGGFSFQIRADQNTANKSSHQFTIVAKDASRNTTITKILTVNVL